jgi:D-3-phosphoglycerate dehydrogenase
VSRVLVCDPTFSLGEVRHRLDGLDVTVEWAETPGAADDVVAILNGPDNLLSAADLERLPALRIVATCSVGYDHIDVEAARKRGIAVCNVPDYCVEEMADSTLALLLALLRGVVTLDRNVRAGGWDYQAAGPIRRLRDTRLGVVGFGRIGRAVAARALALGMEVCAFDPLVPAADIAAARVTPMELGGLLEGCKAFTLHVPLSRATQGLVGAAELARMPPGSVLVNTARARLIDQDALLAALRSGHLAGAALDVLPVEPPNGPPPEHPNLVINPHAAWYSEAAVEAVYRRPVESVRAVLEGREPDGLIGATRR